MFIAAIETFTKAILPRPLRSLVTQVIKRGCDSFQSLRDESEHDVSLHHILVFGSINNSIELHTHIPSSSNRLSRFLATIS